MPGVRISGALANQPLDEVLRHAVESAVSDAEHALLQVSRGEYGQTRESSDGALAMPWRRGDYRTGFS